MMALIFLFCSIVVALSIFAHNQTAVKPNKNTLMGVTIPNTFLNDTLVNRIVTKYKKTSVIYVIVSVTCFTPILFLSAYPSLVIISTFVWCGAFVLINNFIYSKYAYQLFEVKKSNNWITGYKNIISIDTEVSRMKQTMPVSWLWFIPAIIAGVMPLTLFLTRSTQKTLYISFFIVPILLIVLLLYLYKLTVSQRVIAYSENTEINLASNYLHKRLWSICWVISASIEGLVSVISLYLIKNTNAISLLIGLSILSALIISVIIIYTQNKIREKQNRILDSDNTPIYIDEDEYWLKGYYYNPYDMRTMVEKRIGYGFTINMATFKGKLLASGLFGGIAILILGLSFVFISLDFSHFELTSEGETLKIDAPFYGYSFSKNDIKEIKKINYIPSGVKTNGAGTSKYMLGNYNIDGYGSSKLYVNKNTLPVLVIKLKEIYVFINGKTTQETDKYYEILVQKQ